MTCITNICPIRVERRFILSPYKGLVLELVTHLGKNVFYGRTDVLEAITIEAYIFGKKYTSLTNKSNVAPKQFKMRTYSLNM